MEESRKPCLLDIVEREPACIVLGSFLNGLHPCVHLERAYRQYNQTKDIDAFNASISILEAGSCPMRGKPSCDSMNAAARAHRCTLLLKYYPSQIAQWFPRPLVLACGPWPTL